MNDYHIRTSLKRELLARYLNDPDTLIIDELGLMHGAARIDLAVVNGLLHGYELKSDRDTLERLPDQARIYNSVFDRITLVVGYRHAYEAIKMLPDWWGIKIAEMGLRGGIHFISVRRALNNPSLDVLSVAKLLWRDEAISFLDEVASADGVRSKPREVIYKKLIKVVDSDLIRSRVRKQLRCRINRRFAVRQTLNDD